MFSGRNNQEASSSGSATQAVGLLIEAEECLVVSGETTFIFNETLIDYLIKNDLPITLIFTDNLNKQPLSRLASFSPSHVIDYLKSCEITVNHIITPLDFLFSEYDNGYEAYIKPLEISYATLQKELSKAEIKSRLRHHKINAFEPLLDFLKQVVGLTNNTRLDEIPLIIEQTKKLDEFLKIHSPDPKNPSQLNLSLIDELSSLKAMRKLFGINGLAQTTLGNLYEMIQTKKGESLATLSEAQQLSYDNFERQLTAYRNTCYLARIRQPEMEVFANQAYQYVVKHSPVVDKAVYMTASPQTQARLNEFHKDRYPHQLSCIIPPGHQAFDHGFTLNDEGFKTFSPEVIFTREGMNQSILKQLQTETDCFYPYQIKLAVNLDPAHYSQSFTQAEVLKQMRELFMDIFKDESVYAIEMLDPLDYVLSGNGAAKEITIYFLDKLYLLREPTDDAFLLGHLKIMSKINDFLKKYDLPLSTQRIKGSSSLELGMTAPAMSIVTTHSNEATSGENPYARLAFPVSAKIKALMKHSMLDYIKSRTIENTKDASGLPLLSWISQYFRKPKLTREKIKLADKFNKKLKEIDNFWAIFQLVQDFIVKAQALDKKYGMSSSRFRGSDLLRRFNEFLVLLTKANEEQKDENLTGENLPDGHQKDDIISVRASQLS